MQNLLILCVQKILCMIQHNTYHDYWLGSTIKLCFGNPSWVATLYKGLRKWGRDVALLSSLVKKKNNNYKGNVSNSSKPGCIFCGEQGHTSLFDCSGFKMLV